jgi:hypothetical protein
MSQVIPHINLLYELDDSLADIKEMIEPLYSYLYCLHSRTSKENKSPSGFFFLLENKFDHPLSLSAVIDLYRCVTNSLIILSEIEKHKDDYQHLSALKPWLLTVIALKNQVSDISPEIRQLKQENGAISTKQMVKKLFLFTESVRALLEELTTLKKTLLEEIVSSKTPFFTKEPLDLKKDLE